MALTVTTGPTVEPVTLAEAKRHMNISTTADDTYITALIKRVRWYGEEVRAWRTFINTTYMLRLDAFPASNGVIELPRPPLSSVTSIAYDDAADDEQTLVEDTDYRVDAYTEPGRVTVEYGKNWPTTYPQTGAVRIAFIGGYGAADTDVPDHIKQAMLFTVAHWYEAREPIVMGTIVSPVPASLDALWASCSMRGVA
jgi:uncharacterized phiE125 gp8 family phage protein